MFRGRGGTISDMKPISGWHFSIGMALLLALGGCGWFSSPAPLARGLSASQVKHQLLARLQSWQSVSCQVTQTVSLVGQPVQHLKLSLAEENKPAQFVLHITGVSSPIEIFSTPRDTIWYQVGSPHYTVLASLPPSSDDFRLLGTELPHLVAASHITKVHFDHNNIVSLVMDTPLPNGISAQVQLIYDLTTNTPMRIVAKWNGGTVTEVASHFEVNPNLPSNIFSFTPPATVTPAVGLTQSGTALNVAQAKVGFAVALPPQQAQETYVGIDVGQTNKGSSVLLLTYNSPNGNPLVVTERANRSGLSVFPSGSVTATETAGSLSVTVAMLPSGQEMASFVMNKTLVVVQGEASDVDALINLWGGQNSTVPSSTQSSG